MKIFRRFIDKRELFEDSEASEYLLACDFAQARARCIYTIDLVVNRKTSLVTYTIRGLAGGGKSHQ